jgi:hypothetical protein
MSEERAKASFVACRPPYVRCTGRAEEMRTCIKAHYHAGVSRCAIGTGGLDGNLL